VTAASVTAPRTTAVRPAARPRRADSLVARLGAFVALSGFAAAGWGRLVSPPAEGRMAAATAVAGGAALVLGLIGRSGLSPLAQRALAAACTVAAVVVGLVAVGLQVRLLLPPHPGALADLTSRGLAGIRVTDWPYGGQDPSVRLVILLGAPLLLGPAAALAFWPAPRLGPVLRALALVLLLLTYGIGVTEHDPGKPLLRGLLLLILIAAWLWLPRVPARDAARGALLVAAVGVCALPVAARLDADQPWWNWRSWDWFGGGKVVSFDWDHSYGPLSWPRQGTTLLNVRSDRPHYWKAETLDRFDGFRWLRSTENDTGHPGQELPTRPEPPGRPWHYFEFNPRWDVQARVTVRSLRSEFVVGAGTMYEVHGLGDTADSADGTTRTDVDALEKGDSYSFRAYVPDPSSSQMRGSPRGYDAGLAEYTAIFLPHRGESAIESQIPGDAARSAEPPRQPLWVPLRGEPGNRAAAVRALLSSPYDRVYRLARRIAAGAPTAYDTVRAIERYLQRNYTYSERVPNYDLPLVGFLFKHRAGYCQQFSGAMALMLRMLGIPARVAGGFAPGSYNTDTKEWRVRDLDAHSWVQVYFTGIGWVDFDPTPAAAPPASQFAGIDNPDATRGLGGSNPGGPGPLASDRGSDAPGTHGSPGGPVLGLWAIPVFLAAFGLAAAAALLLHGRVRRRGGFSVDAQLRELRDALRRLGWSLPAGMTLLSLERRLARAAGPASAGYVARLRAHRYAAARGPLPGAAERRALRRELTAAGGLRARLLGFLAIPPGGPHRRRQGEAQ
jgi:protein-glutamine gamma-glutamyltransferase